jgi:hypothetical protein
VSRAALSRGYTTNYIGAVIDHLLRMKRAFFACDALDDKAGTFVNENAHKIR